MTKKKKSKIDTDEFLMNEVVDRTGELLNDLESSKRFFTYFLLFFPTIIIAVLDNTLKGFAIKLLLVFYQFISIKVFIDKYYN